MTRELGTRAFACAMWKRGGIIMPIALVAFPLLLTLVGGPFGLSGLGMLLGGAALMLLVLFLVAAQQQRRIYRHFLDTVADRAVRLTLREDGVSLAAATGTLELPWSMIARVARCRQVALLYYHREQQYIAIPTDALPDGAFDFAEARVRASRSR